MRFVTHLTVVAVALLPGLLQAQARPPQQGGTGQGTGQAGGFNFPTPLFQFPGVSQSLNINQDQMRRLQTMTNRMQNDQRGAFTRAFGARTDDREANLASMQRRFNQDWMRGARDILNQDQINRLQQLQLQQQGLGAFADADIQRRLDLSAQQQRGLTDLQRQFTNQLRDFRNFNPQNRDDMRRWQDFQRGTNEKLNSILNQDQRRMWSGMIGQPFNFPPPSSTGTTGSGTGGGTSGTPPSR